MIVAALGLVRPSAGAGDAAAVQRLIQMRHLDELILDVAGLVRAVVLGGEQRPRR